MTANWCALLGCNKGFAILALGGGVAPDVQAAMSRQPMEPNASSPAGPLAALPVGVARSILNTDREANAVLAPPVNDIWARCDKARFSWLPVQYPFEMR
ncbi:hypothetical protein VTN00DRAFT_1062 [Thermoascus crustaceus]|uniref:uncharacterized protein n=1 Tax=Thermoascus crustaceus TaxID=5088 RepID=UPI00374307F7